jgi:MFS family permease
VSIRTKRTRAALRSRLREARVALAANLRDPDLRRAQAAFAAGWSSEWAFTVGLGIVAFRDGGAAAVGLVALLRMLPGAIGGPFLATLADRYRRERIVAVIGVVRAAAIGAGAWLLVLDGSTIPIYALAVISTIAGTPFRAAHSALLPSLCATPDQLTSANVTRGMLDSLSTLLGPLLAAILLDQSTPAAVFAAAAALSLWSGALVWRLSYEEPPRPPSTGPPSMLRDAIDGLRAIAAEPNIALLIGLGVAQTFTRGALNVLAVVMALELLDTGEAGVGVLSAAVGAGAVLGSVGTSLLVGSRNLGGWFGLSIALWGAPLVLIGAFPSELSALLMLALVGVGNALLDVAGFTLFARLIPDEVLARVFGVFESLIAATTGLGSILTPVAIELLGVRGALVALGSICPVLAALAWVRLRSIDRAILIRDAELELLHKVPMLRPLPVPVMEHLARHLGEVHIEAGQTVFEQGEPGDRFYVIARGEAEVIGDGAHIRTLGPGDSFGEIALLRETVRTTTVRARTDLDLSTLECDIFVPAVSGYRPSAAEADEVVSSELATFRPRGLGV